MNDLDVVNVAVKRGDLQVLYDVSFSVKEHTLVALVGPNGGGKSSLLKAILGLLPSSGIITWGKQNIAYLPPLSEIIRTGLPALTIGEFFGFKAAHHHTRDRLLDAVSLDISVLTRSFGELSTGEFQRMMIAWTLCDGPDIVVLDEPTAGLDAEGEERICAYFKQRTDITFIIATHHIHSALRYADQIICINRRKLCDASPQVVGQDTIMQLYREDH